DATATSGSIEVSSTNADLVLTTATIRTGNASARGTAGDALSGNITLTADGDINLGTQDLVTGNASTSVGAASSGTISVSATTGDVTLSGTARTGNATATTGAASS